MTEFEIPRHIEVIGSDGVWVGTVDHRVGANQLKLTKPDQESAEIHRFLSIDVIDWVDDQIHLKVPAHQATHTLAVVSRS